LNELNHKKFNEITKAFINNSTDAYTIYYKTPLGGCSMCKVPRCRVNNDAAVRKGRFFADVDRKVVVLTQAQYMLLKQGTKRDK
jgi:hypothetical protein